MDASGAYLELIDAVMETARRCGIDRPSCRLWSYPEQQAIFAFWGIRLCSVAVVTSFKSDFVKLGSGGVVVVNANLSDVRMRAEIYLHLMQHIAERYYPTDCERDGCWARRAAICAMRHYLPSVRTLAADMALNTAAL